MKTCIAYITQRIVFEVPELIDPTELIKDMTHNSTFNRADAVVTDQDVESIKVDLHPKVTTVKYRDITKNNQDKYLKDRVVIG